MNKQSFTFFPINDTKDRIYAILRSTERPGVEDVIDYLENSNYFSRGCCSHHKENGGLARHSLEVYDYMHSGTSRAAEDSIAVVALLHDLGKTVCSDGHARRSVAILDRLGFALSDDERYAISHHHDKSSDSLMPPLRRLLSFADCCSTGRWKLAHFIKSYHHHGRHV